MKLRGRVVLIGSISTYTSSGPPQGTRSTLNASRAAPSPSLNWKAKRTTRSVNHSSLESVLTQLLRNSACQFLSRWAQNFLTSCPFSCPHATFKTKFYNFWHFDFQTKQTVRGLSWLFVSQTCCVYVRNPALHADQQQSAAGLGDAGPSRAQGQVGRSAQGHGHVDPRGEAAGRPSLTDRTCECASSCPLTWLGGCRSLQPRKDRQSKRPLLPSTDS